MVYKETFKLQNNLLNFDSKHQDSLWKSKPNQNTTDSWLERMAAVSERW